MAEAPIRLDLADGIARITLNRPDRLNAFTVEMHQRLREALDAAGAPEVRVVLITGAGRGFCTGQDLSERKVEPGAPRPDLGATLETWYLPLVQQIRALEKPVITAVNGVAAGAGANLALAGDLVIAARSASFIQSFAKLGLVPDAGGTWWLPRLVGPARAAGLTLLAEKLPAEQAEAWGLIWRCVDDAELVPTVDALAAQLAQAPTRGLAATKRLLQASWQHTLGEQLALERDTQRELGHSDDYAEGVAAFIGKRPARYTGR